MPKPTKKVLCGMMPGTRGLGKGCNRVKDHYALGLCRRCYQNDREKNRVREQGICAGCFKVKEIIARGMCQACYMVWWRKRQKEEANAKT